MGKVSFWRTSPPQPKKSKKARHIERSRPKGILIWQRKDGGLYFSTQDLYGVSCGWTVESTGKEWLADQGIHPGDRAASQVVRDLIDMGYARTRAIERPSAVTPLSTRKPRKQQDPLAKLIRDTELFEKKRFEENARFPALSKKKAAGTKS